MPSQSLLLHSRSFRPLRNTFRSIDFAVDTQAEHIGRKGKKRNAAAETRSRNKRVVRVVRGTGDDGDRKCERREETRAGDRVQLPTYLRE
ncbi:hypothetical protein ALC53_01964 [Atta colombica]|uniref:Uncharacterized protein n=1 Tax=Atta colombica TaxID=520822 RepID=A0A195BRI8_9HYME|nr:hypothetical protein ALC53_01964 [Atta colombica]